MGTALRMFMTVASLLLCPLWVPLTSCTPGTDPSIHQQQIRVRLIPERQSIEADSTVTVTAGSAPGITFRIAPTAVIEQAEVDGLPADFTVSEGRLALRLPPSGKGRPLSVSIRYRARFTDPLPSPRSGSEDPTFGIAATITDQGAFLGAEAGWYPLPPGVPTRRTTSISAPSGIEGITAGKRVEHRTEGGITTSVWQEEHPVGPLSLSAGPYRVGERHIGERTLYTYLFAGNADLSERYLEAAERHLRFYEDLLGPYPYEKFAVVENFFPTGYGFPSWTLLGGTVIRLPFIPETSLPHEIAHNWWGNGVLTGDDGNWSEGLVTYLADYLLKERMSPRDGRDARLAMLADYAALVTPASDFPLQRFSGRVSPASRAIGYGKAAMLFHMIRKGIGDQAFFGGLRELYRQKRYQSASWRDLWGTFALRSQQVPRFEEWLERTGGPQLALEKVTLQHSGDRWIVAGQIVQQPPRYTLKVPLVLESAEGRTEQAVPVAQERTRFSFTVPAPPQRLLLDPEADLFRLLARGELPPTVNSLKGSKNLQAVVTEQCRAPLESLHLLLASLGQAQAPLLSERDLADEKAPLGDRIYCGVPRHGQLTLPEMFALGPQGFASEGVPYGAPDDLLFLVMRSAGAPDVVQALFLPLSAAAAALYTPKITHYGRYSYLIFSNGANRRKGLLPAEAAGSSVVFDGEATP